MPLPEQSDSTVHWLCAACGTFDGPISDGACDVCEDAGHGRSEVERLIPAPKVGFIGDSHSGGVIINGEDVGLNGIDTDRACKLVAKIKAALEVPCRI